jgi:uncharacterized protein YkwD
MLTTRRSSIRTAAAALALVAAAGLYSAEAGAASCPRAHDVPLARTLPAAREATICLVNAERRARDLRPVRPARQLDAAARRHSRAMVRKSFFAHVAPGGAELVDRLRHVRYVPRHRRWQAGENIGWGTESLATPRAIVDAWLASPGHRSILLGRDWREVGVGIVAGAPVSGVSGGATFTAVFGTRNS